VDQISIIGLDLAKGVFHVVGRDASNCKVLSRRLRRSQVEAFFERLPRCVVAMEACSSAHYWARRVRALGHDVRLIPPVYVKPYVVRNKNDPRDADGLSLAVQRPDIPTVQIKEPEQQARACLHRVRDLLIRQRTQAANQIRGLAAEFGLHARVGRAGLRELTTQVEASDMPAVARLAIALQARQHAELDQKIDELTDQISAQALACEQARRLMSIPGIAEICADAVMARMPDPASYRSGRDFAAWLGLTRLDRSTGGKAKTQGRISKRGDKSLRRLLVLGATSVIAAQRRSRRLDPWIAGLLKRRPFKVVATALAAKMARIAWALLVRGQTYQSNHQPKLSATA
jgi:transposase